jgi:hypothetical protein
MTRNNEHRKPDTDDRLKEYWLNEKDHRTSLRMMIDAFSKLPPPDADSAHPHPQSMNC